MRGPRRLFTLFLGLVALTTLGLAVLPAMTAGSWIAGPSGNSLPASLEAAWLAWFFTLWGSLVSAMLFVGAWVAEQLTAFEASRLMRAAEEGLSDGSARQPGETGQRVAA